MKKRTDRVFYMNLRVSDAERTKLKKLAAAEGEPASALIRRWIRQRYEAAFGTER
jgi:hypothetical protein